MITFEKTPVEAESAKSWGSGDTRTCRVGASLSTGSPQEASSAGSPSLRSLKSDSNSSRIEGRLDLFCVYMCVRACAHMYVHRYMCTCVKARG